MGQYKYKETEEVCHIDNLKLVMRVKRFVTEYKKTIVNVEKNETVSKKFLIAIECEWFDEKQKYNKEKFNSHVLVPRTVAEGGKELARLWLNDNFNKLSKKH